MKLALAIADSDALPSAFVVYRGFDACIPKAADLGYQGVELALKSADEIDRDRLHHLLDDNDLEVSAITSGQVFAGLGLMMTSPDESARQQLRMIFRDFIDLAVDFGQQVNIGRVRGALGDDPLAAEARFIDMARELADYAGERDVRLLLEPVNRYEIDFVNSVAEGAALMAKIDRPNMLLMPDVFHMNIEDVTIGPVLAEHIKRIGYIHLADSNRLAPGWGHTDFPTILGALHTVAYDGWLSVEILPKPDPDQAAAQSARFLLPLIADLATC